MPLTEAQKRAKYKYSRDKVKQINLSLYPTEGDIRERLEDMHDKTAYIKGLIRDDIERDRMEQEAFDATEDMSTSAVRDKGMRIAELCGAPANAVYTIDQLRGIIARFEAVKAHIMPIQ